MSSPQASPPIARPELSLELELTPAFHDLDPMQVVWHGNYLRYLERARCALMARFDYDVPQMAASGFHWPIVELQQKFVAPIRYGQRVIVRAQLTEWENRLRVEYLIRDAVSGRRLHRAHTTQVAVSIATGEMQFVCPEILWERLGVKP